jgi:hypothetical protein
MLAGYAPFCSKNTSDVCYKVSHFEKYLKFPSHCQASDVCKDLILKLVNHSENRLGKNGSKEIKAHPFFKGINWLKIKEMKPPFIPQLNSDWDDKYFEKFNYKDPFIPPKESIMRKRLDPEYTGYNFKGKEKDPMDILNIIDLIMKKKEEIEKDKDIKNRVNTENTHENKKTESSSNHNSNNLKDLSNDNELFMKDNNKSTNIINLGKVSKNKIIMIPKQKKEIKKEEPKKNNMDNVNIIINKINNNKNETKKPVIQRKTTFLGNISNSFKIGIKGVFSRGKSEKKKK